MLKAHCLQLNYGKHQVLRQVSFEAAPGECIGILGVNGCGKSTLLKLLAGVLKPTQGQIFISGENACANLGLFAKAIGYVPQENPLMEDLTVQDNLKLWYADSKSDLSFELKEGTLHMLQLDTILHKKVRTLSGGMKKRLSIGCALANKPAILLLDEPTASLDLPCKEDIRNYLKKYVEQGGIVIITTHEEPDLDMCNKILILHDGIVTSAPLNIRGSQLSNLLKENEKEG